MKVKISLVVMLATLIGASGAFATGFNLVSWPLVPANDTISCAMGDSICTGTQITGGINIDDADNIVGFDATTETFLTGWYKTGGPGPDFLWRGTLTNVEADKSYWVFIKTGHPAVVLTMTGAVSTTARTIPIVPGTGVVDKFNFVGSAFPVACEIGGPSGTSDCAGLLASGFTGGDNIGQSDVILHYDGSAWYSAWWKTGGPGPDFLWRGQLTSTQTANHPCFVPGDGYIIQVQHNHTTFTSWTYPVPQDTCICGTTKGKAVVSSKSRAVTKRQLSQKARRALGPSTGMSLAAPEEKAVQERKVR